MRILLVEVAQQRLSFYTALSQHRFAVDRTCNSEEAWDLLNSFLYDLVLLESLPLSFDGINFCRHLRSVGSSGVDFVDFACPRLERSHSGFRKRC